jgi:hypothetical protein
MIQRRRGLGLALERARGAGDVFRKKLQGHEAPQPCRPRPSRHRRAFRSLWSERCFGRSLYSQVRYSQRRCCCRGLEPRKAIPRIRVPRLNAEKRLSLHTLHHVEIRQYAQSGVGVSLAVGAEADVGDALHAGGIGGSDFLKGHAQAGGEIDT